MNFTDFQSREVCFFHNKKVLPPVRGCQLFLGDFYPTLLKMHELEGKEYNSYVSICQYSNIPQFVLQPHKKRFEQFKQWVSVRDLSIVKVDFFIDFDEKSLKSAFTDAFNARNYLLELIGDQAQYLNIYFSGNKGFHLLGKMGESFGTTPKEKLRKNYELAMMLKPLCPSIDETIYDLARVRKLIGSKVYSPTLGETRVISVDSWKEFEMLEDLIAKKDWSLWEKAPIKRLNKIEVDKL
jgi:hypothetical protein